jgi:hypothetical protein
MMILIEYIIARPILEIEFFEKKSKISFLIIGKEKVCGKISYQQQMCTLKRNKKTRHILLNYGLKTKVIYENRQIYF